MDLRKVMPTVKPCRLDTIRHRNVGLACHQGGNGVPTWRLSVVAEPPSFSLAVPAQEMTEASRALMDLTQGCTGSGIVERG